MVQIVPSILSADFARLAEDIGKLEQSGVRMLHVDIMDGHFVPNLTLGPPVVKSLRKATKLRLDLHLMITDPDKYAPIFIERMSHEARFFAGVGVVGYEILSYLFSYLSPSLVCVPLTTRQDDADRDAVRLWF